MMPFGLKKLYSSQSHQSKGLDMLNSEDILAAWLYRIESTECVIDYVCACFAETPLYQCFLAHIISFPSH